MDQHKKIGQPLQYEDMYGNVLGGVGEWNAYVHDALFNPGEWQVVRNP